MIYDILLYNMCFCLQYIYICHLKKHVETSERLCIWIVPGCMFAMHVRDFPGANKSK